MIPNKLNLNHYSFEYDDKGRIIYIKNDIDEQHYEYDDQNRCILHVSNVSARKYAYDDHSRIIKEEYYFGKSITIDQLRYTTYYKYISDYILTERIYTDGTKDYEVYDKDGYPLNRYKISNNYKCASQFKYNKDKTEWVYYEYESASGYYDGRLSKVDSNHSRTIIPINQISDNNYENHLKSILFVETIYFRIMGEMDRILDEFATNYTNYNMKDPIIDFVILAPYNKLEALMLKDNFNTVPILSFKNFPKYLDNLHEIIKTHLIQEIAKIMKDYPVTYVNEFIWSPNNNDELYCNDEFNIKLAGIKE